jgi:hypothetical protein
MYAPHIFYILSSIAVFMVLVHPLERPFETERTQQIAQRDRFPRIYRWMVQILPMSFPCFSEIPTEIRLEL